MAESGSPQRDDAEDLASAESISASQCSHTHDEVSNSCAGRCMLKEGHHTNHGCSLCKGQW